MEENGRLGAVPIMRTGEVVAEKDYSGNPHPLYIRGLGLISSDSENAKTLLPLCIR